MTHGMNVPLLLKAVWRFRAIVIVGACFAVLLATLTYARVSFEGGSLNFEPRESETWASASTVFVTQDGFPWGRTYLEYQTSKEAPPITVGDPGRFAGLAVLYTELANSDRVRSIMEQDGPIPGTLEAVTVLPPVESGPLPLIRLGATSTSEAQAMSIADRYADALRRFLRAEQQRAAIPDEQRVVIEVVQQASPAELVAGRSKMMPLLVFLTVMAVVVGFTFVLENVRPTLAAAPAPGRAPRRGQPTAQESLT
jgi:hypothetical protein